MRTGAGCLIFAAAIAGLAWPAPSPADKRVFALVPKAMNVFFEQAHLGCKKAQLELAGVECLYVGPSEHSEDAQVRIIHDLIIRRVSGLAIAPSNAPAVAKALKKAQQAGIIAITFDADLLPKDRGYRRTYIGTNNYDLGAALGRKLTELKSAGGLLAIQSGGAAADNLNERMQGLRDAIAGKGWQEAAGTPVYCNDDFALAAQQLADILSKYQQLDAFVAVGGWPQLAPEAYRAALRKHLPRFKSGSLTVLVADTLDVQMEILREGLSNGQVGQRPFEMGYRAIYTLNQLADGKEVPDPIHTGLDICSVENAAACLKR